MAMECNGLNIGLYIQVDGNHFFDPRKPHGSFLSHTSEHKAI